MSNTQQIDPEREKQVSEWLNELQYAAQRSYDTCRQLRDRLNPVMRQKYAEPEKTETPELELVDVAQAIREAVKVLNATSEIHSDTLRLLEV